MKLRVILIILSLLAFFSASAGGYLYYSSSKNTAFSEANRQASLHAETIKGHLISFLSENLQSVRALAGLEELRQALSSLGKTTLAKADLILDHFNGALNADVCYLMDSNGKTVASSNRNESDSFVGKNYGFRPYFQEAMKGRPSIYMALGITSKKRGVYYSYPVFGRGKGAAIGVVVIKAAIAPLEKDFSRAYEGVVTLIDPDGLIFISNRTEWVYQFLWKPSPEEISKVAETRQFGRGPWNWTGLQRKDESHAVDLSGSEYVIYQTEIDNYPGWNVVYLHSVQAISKRLSGSLFKITGFVVLAICGFIGLLVIFLYRMASYHIAQRKSAEEALRESQETAMALLNAPTEGALLLDQKGNILALNKTAAERFGKGIHEVIGACAFDLFPPEIAAARKAHHDWVVRVGKPFRYEDRRGGRWLNTNLYPVFDTNGKVVRVAVFSRDVTEQKRAENGLRAAKEQLTRYSKELERRVRNRTREITGILRYTPAVVFIKDKQSRYTLINSRFEELFGVTNREIKGKTDHDIFPKKTADQLRASDLPVLSKGLSSQAEERIPQNDGIHTYLSTKFPLFDAQGVITGLCGIATDITEVKKAQDQLRKLSGSIMNGQEKERAAIARELHDELGQMLTALRIDSVWMWNYLRGRNPQAAKRALKMCEHIDKSIDEVRGMSVRLRPGVLDDLGLIAALEWYTTDFEKRTGINCSFMHLNVNKVDDVLATAAYRITQEALTNVARHSSASQVDVVIQRRNGLLSLSVRDNGRGMNAEQLSDPECLGIVGMRERAGLVGGSLEIKFQPDQGTEVCFRVPFHSEREGVH